jgi:hypothetical protein
LVSSVVERDPAVALLHVLAVRLDGDLAAVAVGGDAGGDLALLARLDAGDLLHVRGPLREPLRLVLQAVELLLLLGGQDAGLSARASGLRRCRASSRCTTRAAP